MRRISQSLTLWLMFDFVRRNRNAFVLVLPLAVVLVVLFTNEPTSTRVIEGRFVRLNMKPSNGAPSIWVYVDLPDGRTTAVEAWNGWRPPAAGSAVHLNEMTLLWFGKSYSLALASQADVASDGP